MSVSPTSTINLLQTSSTSSTDPILRLMLRLSLFTWTFSKSACRFRGALGRINEKIVGRYSEIAVTITQSLWLVLSLIARSCLWPCSCFPACSSSSSLSVSLSRSLSHALSHAHAHASPTAPTYLASGSVQYHVLHLPNTTHISSRHVTDFILIR